MHTAQHIFRSVSWQSPARREEVRVSVCELVKYYGHQLLIDAIVSCAFPSMVFIHVESMECSPARSTSFINMEEVSAVQHVVARLRETRPWASIAVLTFYKGQLQARRLIVLRSLCCYNHCYNHACHTIQRCACPVRGGRLGSRPKKMYGERLGDGVEYHLMSPTPRRQVPFTTGRRAH